MVLDQAPRVDAAATTAIWTVGLFAGIGLVLVAPMLLTGITFRDFGRLEVVMAMAITAWSGTRLAFMLTRDRVELTAGVAWIFIYVWFGVSALAQVVVNRFPFYDQTFPREMQVAALGTILIGIGAFDVGNSVRRARARAAQPTLFQRVVVPRRIWLISVFGVLGTLYGLAKVGPLLFSSRYSAQAAISGGVARGQRLDQIGNHAQSFLKIAIIWVPGFVALYLLLALRRARRDGINIPRRFVSTDNATMLLLVLAVCVLISANPIGNPRYRFAGVGFALLCAVWPMVTPRRAKLALSGLLASMFILYPLGNAFRYDQRDFHVPSVRSVITDTPDFAMFQQELNAQLYVRTHGHTYGRQVLGVAFVFVPRALWPAKPTATGNLISQQTRINASASVWAVAYVDGGWPLVAGVFFAYGWFVAAADDAFWRSRYQRARFVAVAVPVFAAFQIFFLRGDPLAAVGEITPLIALLFFATRASARPRAHFPPLRSFASSALAGD